MSDFKVIETQEQLDALIGDRIKKAKEMAEKKFEGYISAEDLDALKNKHKEELDKLNKSLSEANEKIATHDKVLAERDGKIKKYETDSVKTRIAHETGLTFDAVGFLTGEDEESIRKSAEILKGLIGATNVAPLANLDSISGSEKDAAYKTILKGVKGE